MEYRMEGGGEVGEKSLKEGGIQTHIGKHPSGSVSAPACDCPKLCKNQVFLRGSGGQRRGESGAASKLFNPQLRFNPLEVLPVVLHTKRDPWLHL